MNAINRTIQSSYIEMLKTLPSLVEHHGGSEIHLIWIEMFTAPCKFVDVVVAQQTPVDHFLQAFDYKPASNRAIRREIEKSHNRKELEYNLSQLFAFEKVQIVNLLVLAKTACEMPSQSSQSKNLGLLPGFIFRGFIVLSYRMKEFVTEYFSGTPSPFFTKEYWELLHFPLDFLLKSEMKDLKKVIKILDPFLDAFSNLQDILSLPVEHLVRASFVTVISSIIPYLSIEWDLWTRKIWDFLLATFHEAARQIGQASTCNDLVCIWHGFIQLVQPCVAQLDVERSESLATVTAMFLQGIERFSPSFEYKYFTFGMDSLALIGGIKHPLETEVVVEVVKGMNALARWLMTGCNMTEELEDFPEEKEAEPVLVWSDWKSYFDRSALLPDYVKIKFKNHNLSELVESLRDVFVHAPQLLIGVFEGLADAMSHYTNTERVGLCSVFCLALSGAKTVPVSDFLQAFLFSTILSSSSPDPESPKLMHKFRNVVLSMMFSFCCISSELLSFVLKTISLVVRGSECRKIHYFMPLFRSLLLIDAQISFVHHFFASGIVEDLQWLVRSSEQDNASDELAGLYQIMVITRPMEVFGTFTFLPILRDMAMNPRLQKMLGPCFKIGMSLSHTPPIAEGKKAAYMTLEQVVTIFRQCSMDLSLTDLCLTLVNYVSESIEIFDEDVLHSVVKLGMFDGIAALPGIIKSSQAVVTVVAFFTRICARYHDFRLSLDNENSVLMKKLETGIMHVPIDNNIIESIIKFMFNQSERTVIVNRPALRLLLKVIEGTDHEESVLKTLYMLCKNDIANAYSCFSCDVVSFIMNKISHDRLVQIGIPLFQTICSSFFSPLAMSETMTAMRLTDDGKRQPKHQALLDCYLDLLKEKNRIPVSGFYHFNGPTTGIFGPHVDPALFTQPFTIVTAFKQEDNLSGAAPIIALTEKSGNNFTVCIKQNQLTIRQCCNGAQVSISTIPHNIRSNHWYTIMLIFNQTNLQIYIDNKAFDPITIAKLEFANDVNILLGTFDVDKFVGDIGPTIFFRLTEPDEVAVRYAQFNSTRSNLKNIFIKYLPWSIEEGEVCDVVVDGDRAFMIGSAIPFCCTVTEVVQYDMSFESFLPLLLYVNHDEEGSTDEQNNVRFFVTVLRILKCLLNISCEMQHNFGELGGFQLLAGFFAQINVRYFTPAIQEELKDIFQSFADPTLRGQMCEFIWLNFDLWSRMSYEFQLSLCTTTLYALWTDDKTTGHDSFKCAPVDFVLYEIQRPLKKDAVVDSKVMMFPYCSPAVPGIENPYYELTEEQDNELKRVQWHLFSELLNDSDSPSIFLNVLLLAYGHENEVVRVLSTDIINKYLMQSSRNVVIAMEMVDGYDFLLWVCKSDPFPVLKNVIYMMLLLANQEKKGNFSPRGTTRDMAIMSLALQLYTVEWPSSGVSLLEWCFNHMLDKQGRFGKIPSFKHPEFLPIVAAGCHALDREMLKKLVHRMEQSLIEHPDTIIPLTKNITWSMWLFRILIHAFNLPDEMASFCHTFVLILFELCKEKMFDYFFHFFAIVHVIEQVCHVDLSMFLTECLTLMLTRSKIEDFGVESRLVLSRVAVAHLLFAFNYRQKLNAFDSSILSVFDSLFIKLSKQSDDDWSLLGKAFDISTSKRMTDEGKWADLSLATETLKVLHSLWESGTVPEFQSNIVQVPLHIAYVVISFMILTEDVSEGIKKNIIASNDELAAILKSPEEKTEMLEGLAQGLPNRVQESAIQFRVGYLPALIDDVEAMSRALSQMLAEGSDKMKRQYLESVEGFQKGYGKTRLLVSLHNHKLMSSFLREVTSNGGPWSLSYKAVKWRCTTKIDGQGRNIFMSVNRNFDDHRKASALRDALEFTPGEAEEATEMVPFKRILEQKSSFVPITVNIKAATFRVKVISLMRHFTGSLHVTPKAIVFDGAEYADGLGKPLPPEMCKRKFFEIPFGKVGFIFTRMYLHEDLNCEIYTNTRKTYSLAFASTQKRTDFLNAVKKNTEKVHMRPIKLFEAFQHACGCCVQTMPSSELLIRSKIMKKWQKRKISTFQYLFYLNILSGRSFNDITQYPVYPWVLADYTSDKLDLEDPSIYRDLSKPVGALNEEKLESLKRIEEDIDDWTQQCLYRTHYSNPAAVIGYLVRTEPFSTLHIQLQENKYDHPERMFFSIGRAWRSIVGKNLDFRELIPEFFCTPHFLQNENGFDLGQVGGKSISEVELPPWARSAFEFVSIHRQALESEYVSLHISDWIDLIFGVNQRSREHNSLFHPFTYTDLVMSSEFPESSIMLAKHYCANFGICPAKLFTLPHPKRNPRQVQVLSARDFPHMGKIVAATKTFMMTNECVLINLSDRTAASLSLKWKNYALCHLSKEQVLTVAYDGTGVHVFDVSTNSETGVIAHSSSIINCLEVIDSHYLLTGGSDCGIYVWNVKNLEQICKIAVHSMPIVAMDGDGSLGVIASIDQGHNVYLTLLLTRHVLHMFTLKWPNHTTHKIKLFRSGMVVVSSHVTGEKETALEFYDLCGNSLGRIDILGAVTSMESIESEDYSEFLAVTTSHKSAYLINCDEKRVQMKLGSPVVPEYLGYIGGRTFVVVRKKGENEYLAPVDF